METEREFVRYWLHNGFVNVDSEKMSKSLGNFFTIRDVSYEDCMEFHGVTRGGALWGVQGLRAEAPPRSAITNI